jgi:4-amino-4-deoxy-L-arabinose transferase-like glycosyltransferase
MNKGLGERRPDVRTILAFLAAIVLAAFYLATSIYVASNRLFWMDEIVTVDVAWLPQWGTILTALGHAADSLPPMYYWVVRFSGDMFGHSELAARLPSAVAMVAGLLITFDCARRLTDGLHGLIALSLLGCSFLPYYGYEARSYAIYFMLSALGLWIWTCTRDDRVWPAVLFGVVLGLAVAVHYYAVLLIVPYALLELYRWKPWQRPSAKLIAGILGAVVGVVLLWRLMSSFASRYGGEFWARPSLDTSGSVYAALFPDGLLLLAISMVWVVLRPNPRFEPQPMQSSELLGWFFLCIPLAGFVLAKVKTHAFLPRYFICVLPGVAVAFACLLWRHFRNSYRVSAGILLLLISMGVSKQVQAVRRLDTIMPVQAQARARQYLQVEDSLFKDGKKFMVFSNNWLFMAGRYYSGHPENCIFLLDSDPGNSSNLGVSLALGLASYYPLRFWTVDDLKQHIGESALIQPTPDTVDALKRAGFEVDTRFDKPLEVGYPK